MLKEALKIFAVGFPGVILTLIFMAFVIYLVGRLITMFEKKGK